MTPAAAKSYARSLTDSTANPPVKAVAATNGPSHKSVVHVTFGEPRTVTKEGKDGQVRTTTPTRPQPYTVS